MKIKISPGAERDIADGCDFYHQIDPNLAVYFQDSISADIDSLLLYAGIHARLDGWYYTFASRFPFVLWYGIKDDCIIVYAVLDGRRDPDHNAGTLHSRRRQTD